MLQGDKYLVFYRIPRMESYRRGEFKKKLKINVVLIERGQKKRIQKKKKKKEYEVLCSNDLQNRNFDRYSSISLIIVKGRYLIL